MCFVVTTEQERRRSMSDWRTTDRQDGPPPFRFRGRGPRGRGQRRPFQHGNRGPGPRQPWNADGPRQSWHGSGPPPQPSHPSYHIPQNYAPRPRGPRHGFSHERMNRRPPPPFHFGMRPTTEHQPTKLCPNCNNFSSDLRFCTQCGQHLRPDAKMFKNPASVNAKLINVIEAVADNHLGPDFQPLQPASADVLGSILQDENFRNVVQLPPSFNINRMTAEGSVPVVLAAVAAESERTIPPDNLERKQSVEPIPSTSRSNVNQIIVRNPPSPEIIEIILPSPSTKTTPDKANQSGSSKPKVKDSKKDKSKKKASRIIIVSSDDEDDQNISNENNSIEKSVVAKEKEPEVPPTVYEEQEASVTPTSKNKSARKSKTKTKIPSKNANTEVIVEANAQPAKEKETTKSGPSIDKSEKKPAENVPDKVSKTKTQSSTSTSKQAGELTSNSNPNNESVRLCHCCDAYSFDLQKCSLCNTSFKKKDPKVNSVVELTSLSKFQIKSVHYRNKKKDEANPDQDENELLQSPPKPPSNDEVHEVVTAGEAQQVENDEVEPTLTSSTEEPKGLLKEDTNEVCLSLIDSAPALGPYGNTVPSDTLGGVRYVRLCTKCFSYRDDLTKCGICKKPFTKSNPIVNFSALTKEQLEQAEKRNQGYLAEQIRLDMEKIKEKVKKYEGTLLRQTTEKYGLHLRSGGTNVGPIGVGVAASPSSIDSPVADSLLNNHENENVRKRKSAPVDESVRQSKKQKSLQKTSRKTSH